MWVPNSEIGNPYAKCFSFQLLWRLIRAAKYGGIALFGQMLATANLSLYAKLLKKYLIPHLGIFKNFIPANHLNIKVDILKPLEPA
jgi:hypothetical protein